ncbi:hypothetical protein HKD37_19G053621 [Glycine soja]
MKERIEGFFSTESLRWILRIPLRLKHPSWCGGLAASNGGSWWPPVVMDGGEGVRFWVSV